MPPLPPSLQAALATGVAAAPKRERTRRQLLLSAMSVYRQRGVAAATLQDIGLGAGVASGTVYNYFATREEVAEQVAAWLAETLCERISESYAAVTRGVERMAIGNRRYLWLAEQSPEWALLLLEVAAAVPALAQVAHSYALADLRLGVRQRSFRPVTEAAAMDLITGTISSAMATIAHGHAPKGHASAVAASVLRALGVAAEEASSIASLPLPDFPQQESEPEGPKALKRAGAGNKRRT